MQREQFAVGLGNENARFLETAYLNCPPNQMIRELTQNALEAVHRAKLKDGRVEWSSCIWDGYRKLTIVDAGNSMTEEEIQNYMGNIGSGVSDNGNFGLGSKVATMPQNKYGVVYACFPKDGTPHVCVFKKVGNQYIGEKMDFAEFNKICSVKVPELIKKQGHGTFIILLGNSKQEDTTGWDVDPVTNHPKKAIFWIALYLSKRYYSFPENTSVIVIPPNSEEKGKRTNATVKSQEFLEEQYAESKGIVSLSNGRMHWAILKEEKQKTHSHGASFDICGSFANILNGEIYQFYDGNEGYNKMRRFGIVAGAQYVILRLEMDGVVATHTRNGLMSQNGSPVDIYATAEEFQDKMPKALKDFIRKHRESSDKVNATNRQERDLNHAATIVDLFDMEGMTRIINCSKTVGETTTIVRKYKPRKRRLNLEQEEGENETPKNPRTRKGVEINQSSKNTKQCKANLVEPHFDFNGDGDLSVFASFSPNKDKDNFYVNLQFPLYQDWLKLAQKELNVLDWATLEEFGRAVIQTKFLEEYSFARIECKMDNNMISEDLSSQYLTKVFKRTRYSLFLDLKHRYNTSKAKRGEIKEDTANSN